MNNLLSYCGLVDARISAPEKDLPVEGHFQSSKLLLKIWKSLKTIHTFTIVEFVGSLSFH